MTDIGRAGMVMKGDYNSASTYEVLDAVSYQNGLYIAKQNVPAGTVPTNTSYWQKAINPQGLQLEIGGNINSYETDLNDLINAPTKSFMADANTGHTPTSNYWLGLHINITTGVRCIQLITTFDNSNTYIRIAWGGGWTSWKEL